ncbi:MAG: D-aminoacyl-tRNA deacylase [Actinomycetota bacterium]|nr:D-aminoacyl-tRNA deacylase [Actinomycetota bacterium]
MRALVQRVSRAAVVVEGEETARIGLGLLVLLGVAIGDTAEQADRLAAKLLKLRVFADASGRFEHSLGQVGGEVLCVSQFTLLADTRRGNRPSFAGAAPSEEAEWLYERVRGALDAQGGAFGARMQVSLVNDGPVTLMVEA